MLQGAQVEHDLTPEMHIAHTTVNVDVPLERVLSEGQRVLFSGSEDLRHARLDAAADRRGRWWVELDNPRHKVALCHVLSEGEGCVADEGHCGPVTQVKEQGDAVGRTVFEDLALWGHVGGVIN